MKTAILVIVAALIAAGASFAIARRTDNGRRITDGVYFRDAYGRCLRLQPELAQNGSLVITEMPSTACAKREAVAR